MFVLLQAKNFVNKFILEGMVTYYDDQDLKNAIDFVQKEVNFDQNTSIKDD